MKAVIETGFANANAAKKALSVMKTTSPKAEDEDDSAAVKRAEVTFSCKGSSLHCVVSAKDFTALRARVTSLLRDLRVVYDAAEAAQGN
ncbi:TPA: hypothetical protein HA318_04780 [Candidatus Micrarchaeota archaeon]|nr:MAG: hypothetical protein AUJ65_04955 [Candidatus Micrarchaeota archaeon CG1_02_51_15]HII39287.1 hypothetical protein [Candidatus Micrarchaeota archaeon]